MRPRRLVPAFLAGFAAIVVSGSVVAAPDLDNGQDVFKTCRLPQGRAWR